jgi:hypothetical protein
MGHFRALKALQAPSLGLKRPGEDFHWSGSIIGWHVEALDDDAKKMVAERAKVLKERGVKVEDEDRALPTQPFPKDVMRPSAGMTAPTLVGQTMSAIETDSPAADASAPQMAAPPRRRRAASE